MTSLKLLAFNHILPSIASAFVSLLLVLLMLTIFRIKRPALRHTFLIIPLIKPLFLLIGGVYLLHARRFFSLQFPDPFSLVPESYDKLFANNGLVLPHKTSLYELLLTIALFAVVLLLSFRWVSIIRYRAKIVSQGSSIQGDYERAFAILKELAHKAKITTPKLVFTDTSSPFIIGITRMTVALPSDLIDHLADEEVEAILAHEIAHIKRRDNWWLWLSLICKDLMFFNPIAWFVFKYMADERELAADELAAGITGKPIALAEVLVKLAERIMLDTKLCNWSIIRTTLVPRSNLEKRVNRLLKYKPSKLSLLKAIPIGFLFFALFYIRIFFHLKVTKDTLFTFFS